MRYFSFVFVIFVTLSTSVHAQTFVEGQVLMRESTVSPQIDGQIEIPGKLVNFYSWFLVSDSWGEALVGVSKSVKPWLWLAFAAGVETDDKPWRINPNIWAGKGRYSTFLALEQGGSGFWYKSFSTVDLVPRVSVGVHSQSFYGTGPLVQVKLGQGMKVWVSVVDGPASILGLVKSF